MRFRAEVAPEKAEPGAPAMGRFMSTQERRVRDGSQQSSETGLPFVGSVTRLKEHDRKRRRLRR